MPKVPPPPPVRPPVRRTAGAVPLPPVVQPRLVRVPPPPLPPARPAPVRAVAAPPAVQTTGRYTRAIEQLQKLSAWIQRYGDWIDVAEDIGKLEDKAPGAIELHGKTQPGMTIKSIWKNIWDRGGLNLQSDLDRYSDWIQRIKQALLRIENPNVDTGYRDPHLDRFSLHPVYSSDSYKPGGDQHDR
jgi:hypothetical protein